MKNILLPAIFILPFISHAQTEWKYTGNVLSSTGILGSTNNFALSIRTNNTERINIGSGGTIKFNALGGTGSGLMLLNASGESSRLSFSGNAYDVLLGNGSFAGLSTATGWSVGTGKTTTMGKVGIGTSTPTSSLEVIGNGAFSGTVYAEHFTIADASLVQGQLSFTNNMILNGYDPIAGNSNEIYTTTQPFYLQSAPLNNNNTLINFNNTGKVGIGTNAPVAKFHVYGATKLEGELTVTGETVHEGKTRFYRISGLAGDTVIRFGDSTVFLNHIKNQIYVDPASISLFSNRGIGIGSTTAIGKGIASTGIGYQSSAMAHYSYTMGHNVRTIHEKSIVIGSGVGTTQLTSVSTNSLLVGFNSNLPTLYVGPASGTGTIGKVGIGTTSPMANFQVTNSGNVKTYVSSTGAKNAQSWVVNNLFGYGLGIDSTGRGNIYYNANVPVSAMTFHNNGKVSVNTTCAPYQFTVEGTIGAREIWVKTENWCDYVFTPQHKRMNLNELEAYIIQNKHLPNVPSEKEILDKGEFELSSTSKIYLEKIEELTLYMIEMNKRLEQLEKENAELKKSTK